MPYPYDPRARRSSAGQQSGRRRLPPRVLRAPAPPPRKGLSKFITRALFALAFLLVLLLLSGVGAAYAGYAQLADSLKDRIKTLDTHTSFQTTRIYDRHNVLLYEFFGAGKRTRVPLDQISTRLISATIAIED